MVLEVSGNKDLGLSPDALANCLLWVGSQGSLTARRMSASVARTVWSMQDVGRWCVPFWQVPVVKEYECSAGHAMESEYSLDQSMPWSVSERSTMERGTSLQW